MPQFYFSWLLHDPNMELRSMYTPYILAVDRYLKKMAEILALLQVSMCYYTLYSLSVLSLANYVPTANLGNQPNQISYLPASR